MHILKPMYFRGKLLTTKPFDIHDEIRKLEVKYTVSTGKFNKIIHFVLILNIRAYRKDQDKLIMQSRVDASEERLAACVD